MSCVHEYVCHLQISVYDVFLSEVRQPIKNIFDDRGCLGLVEVTILSQTGLEVSLTTEFSDDVAVSVTGEYFKALENIGMTQFFEHVDF